MEDSSYRGWKVANAIDKTWDDIQNVIFHNKKLDDATLDQFKFFTEREGLTSDQAIVYTVQAALNDALEFTVKLLSERLYNDKLGNGYYMGAPYKEAWQETDVAKHIGLIKYETTPTVVNLNFLRDTGLEQYL